MYNKLLCIRYSCLFIQDPIVISGISVAVKSYRVDYINSITGDQCGPAVVLSLTNEITACTSNDICNIRRDLILPGSCGNDDMYINVTVSATSVLGTGPPTQPLRIGWCCIKSCLI